MFIEAKMTFILQMINAGSDLGKLSNTTNNGYDLPPVAFDEIW